VLCLRHQHRRRESPYHLSGSQEPRQCDLALPAGCPRLLHLVAGLSPGRLQPQQRLLRSRRPGIKQYCSPLSYASDNLTNNEIGWKTEFFDHRLQWNGAVYREDWNNVQVAFFDPGSSERGFRDQRTRLPHPRGRNVLRRRGHRRADCAGRGGVEHEQADQLALPGREQPGALVEPGEQVRIRTADLRRRQSVRAHRRTSANSPRCNSTHGSGISGR